MALVTLHGYFIDFRLRLVQGNYGIGFLEQVQYILHRVLQMIFVYGIHDFKNLSV